MGEYAAEQTKYYPQVEVAKKEMGDFLGTISFDDPRLGLIRTLTDQHINTYQLAEVRGRDKQQIDPREQTLQREEERINDKLKEYRWNPSTARLFDGDCFQWRNILKDLGYQILYENRNQESDNKQKSPESPKKLPQLAAADFAYQLFEAKRNEYLDKSK